MIKNYVYGLLDPTLNAELVHEQMRAGHRYYNQLVEIEQRRRAVIAQILSGHQDTEALAARVAALVTQLDEARLVIKASRQSTRGRSETAQMRESVKELVAELRGARATFKAARDIVKTDLAVAAAITVADDHATTQVKAARATCGTYWGTYKLSEEAIDASKKGKPGQPTAPPRFKRWTGEGRVSVQLQGGISVEELFGSDTQIQIAPVSPDAYDPGKSRGVHRRASRTILRLRVQSTEKGRPIWAEWPLILHRPIPTGARIKVATVSCRRHDCRRWDWRLMLTLEIPNEALLKRPLPDGGAVALNLGWCRRPGDTVRSGYIYSSDAAFDREVTVPPSTIDRVEKSEGIRSQRDKDLDAMRARLVPWLRAHETKLPAWLVERAILSREPREKRQLAAPGDETKGQPPVAQGQLAAPGDGTKAPTEVGSAQKQGQLAAPGDETAGSMRRSWHITQWRSPARFRALAFLWRQQRFAVDNEGYQLLEDWRYRDEHLERYESGMRTGGLLDRRERYRQIAADLATRYRTLIIDDFDLREFQRSPAPEDTRIELPVAKRNQRHAAGSELRGALLNAFGPARVLELSSNDVTRTCHACGQINDWNHALAREHTCAECRSTWDQDQNACKNLLKRWREHEQSGVPPAVKPERKESRSERLRRTRWKPKIDVTDVTDVPPIAAPIAAPTTAPIAAVVVATTPVVPPSAIVVERSAAPTPGRKRRVRERSDADASRVTARSPNSVPGKELRSPRQRNPRAKP